MEESFSPEDVSAESRHKRGTSRDSLFMQATIRAEGGKPMTLKVRNLSSGGMMIDCPVAFHRGTELIIELKNLGAIAGHVAWARDGRLGVAFAEPIDPQTARKAGPGNGLPPGFKLVRPETALGRRPGLKLD